MSKRDPRIDPKPGDVIRIGRDVHTVEYVSPLGYLRHTRSGETVQTCVTAIEIWRELCREKGNE